jgi:hypothetical protein
VVTVFTKGWKSKSFSEMISFALTTRAYSTMKECNAFMNQGLEEEE